MPTVKKIVFRVVLPAMLTILVFIGYMSSRRPRGCGFGGDKFTIGTVNYGPFVEYIPQTGHIEVDSVTKHPHVWVDIDELYFPRISTGLNATTTFNNRDYQLKIDAINPTVANGRFRVRLEFNPGDSIKVQNLSLRLRIQLADTSMQILLPVGGFYKDTGGNWVFVMEGDNKALKRNITLGRKMGSEYFEVLKGLTPGERVITSSYENYGDKDMLDADDLNGLNKRGWFARFVRSH